MNYDLHPWQWLALMRYAHNAERFGEYVRFILHLAAVPSLLQLERHAYPGQPSTRAEHVPARCTCWYWTEAYGLRITGGFGSYRFDQGRADCSGFQINPACPHHGHLANTHLIERLWEDPYLNGILRDPYDMDDDERRSP